MGAHIGRNFYFVPIDRMVVKVMMGGRGNVYFNVESETRWEPSVSDVGLQKFLTLIEAKKVERLAEKSYRIRLNSKQRPTTERKVLLSLEHQVH
jgi:hypothetical protein